MGRIKPREQKAKEEQENDLLKAVKMYQDSQKSDQPATIALIVESCNVAPSTLRDRLAGAQNRVIAHQKQQNLLVLDEKDVLRWVEKVERAGFPPRIAHVREAANRLSTKGFPMGKHWITRFLNRYPELSTKLTITIEFSRVDQITVPVFRDHYQKLRTVITSHNITPELSFNMDEKGFIMGIFDKCKIICKNLGRHNSTIKVGTNVGSQELLTVIEYINAKDSVLPPMIIFKGAGHYMGWHHG